jgi:hypothetical protein
MSGIDGRFETRTIRGRAHVLFRVSSEQHQRRAIVGAHSPNHVSCGVARPIPVIPVAHARGLIEEDDDFASAAPHRRRGGALAQERSRKRRDEQQNCRRAQAEQQPVTDSPPPNRLIGNAADEHQRGELDHALALALNEMNQHGDGNRAHADEK